MSPRTKRDIDGDLVIAGNLTVLGGLNQKHFLKVRTDLASTSEAVANIEASSAELISFTYLERRYFRSDTKPPTPTGSSPTGWELSPPLGSAKLWMTQASRRGDGALLSDWSTPISSTARQPVTLYMRSYTRPVTPSGADPAGWSKAPPTGGAMLWGVNGFYVLSPGSSSPGALRPHVGLRPSEGLRPFSPSWSAPYLVLDAIHSKPVGYLGKFTNHPPSRSGDWWLIYAASDTPIQRGVWLNDAGTYRRIASDTAADSAYIAPALTDILEVANAGYGVVSDYGAVTFIANLVANTAFIENLIASKVIADGILAHDIDATGSITGALLKTSDGMARMAKQAQESGAYTGFVVSDRDINPASPGGSVLQLACASAFALPALMFKRFASGAWRTRAYLLFEETFQTLELYNALTGLIMQIGSGLEPSTLRLIGQNGQNSIVAADYINAAKTVKPVCGVELSAYYYGAAGTTYGAVYSAIADYVPLGHRLRATGFVASGGATIVYIERVSTSELVVGFIGGGAPNTLTFNASSTELFGRGYIAF